MVSFLQVSAGLQVLHSMGCYPHPYRNLGASMGEFTCGFFHRFPTGTFCIPRPVQFPTEKGEGEGGRGGEEEDG